MYPVSETHLPVGFWPEIPACALDQSEEGEWKDWLTQLPRSRDM